MPVSSAPEAAIVEAEPSPEQSPVPSVVGAWEDNFYGKRRMTFQDDGTATMELELDPVSRLLYGPKLVFHIDWKQEDDRLVLQMNGGEPAEATKTLGKLFGETSEQTIESLTADEMRLRSRDSGKLYVHRRIAEPSGDPAAGGVE